MLNHDNIQNYVYSNWCIGCQLEGNCCIHEKLSDSAIPIEWYDYENGCSASIDVITGEM